MQKLNLGCGKNIKNGYVNADITPFEGVDKAFDFDVFPYPFSDGEFDEILADNVLEHLDDIPAVMKELHRLTKPDGEIRIIVPYYNCYGAYNDITHKHYFSHLSFEPFYKKNTRGNYFIEEKFKLMKLKLIPTRLGKLLLFDFIRLPLSFIFGQIIQAIDVTLIVKK
ncbi:MAG: methyltransferase domain-containing protein [Patescibacteria group bacterium]|nr:methyltransferase domain-containing protein [Patescibacteria group bacterium]